MKTIKNLKEEEIRKSILQLAIQGKLVKQDPNDEPASELVKRIYAEKQRLIKEGKIKKDKNESFIFKGDDNCYYEKIGNNAPVKFEDLPFDIPDSWTWIRFPNLVNFTLGKTPERHNPKYWSDGKYPWFSIADMKDKKTVTETKEKISEYSLSEYFNSCTSPAGTLIMSFKLTVGRVSILGVDAIHNEAIISIFPYLEENNTIRDWLFYTLGLIVEYVDHTDAIKGSTLNKEKMNSMLIPLPPIKEQNRIISKLLESEPLIVKYGDIENKLSLLESEFPEKLKKSILQYAIEGKLVKQDPNDEPASVLLERIKAEKERLIKEGKIKRDKNESYIYQGDDKNYYENLPFDIPFNWSWTTISNITNSYIGLTYKPTDISQKINDAIVLRSSNIQNRKLDLSDIVRVSCIIDKKLKVNQNDIIICARNGSKKLVGKSALIDDQYENMTFGAFMAICKTQFYKYVYTFLQSPLFYSQLALTSVTTTINQLTQKAFNSFIIPLPPMNEQEKIANKIYKLFKLVD